MGPPSSSKSLLQALLHAVVGHDGAAEHALNAQTLYNDGEMYEVGEKYEVSKQYEVGERKYKTTRSERGSKREGPAYMLQTS